MTPVPMNAIECEDMKSEGERESERGETKTNEALDSFFVGSLLAATSCARSAQAPTLQGRI
jgi:hypothetical protein